MTERSHPRPGGVIAAIRSQAPSLLPAEQAVAGVLLGRSSDIVEMTSTQVADLAGASRATVVRTCQALGFSGYQQLRVMLARDAAFTVPAGAADGDGEGPGAIVARTFSQVGSAVDAMTAILDPDAVAAAVALLASARRVVVVGNGLSATLAADAAGRLTSIGRDAQAPSDAIAQQVAARLLGTGDLLLVISGSGSSTLSLQSVRAAASAGAGVVAVTAFSHSPIATAADIALIVGMPDLSFASELTATTRIPQAILIEGLIAATTHDLGDDAARAKAIALEVVGDSLAE
ncbi:MurR/RpiR family transcriptional regulator [Spelaeicoccus albus]|uniref:DNA-binding MurR/RpiR family transcriptional regulator n=1 Tax=Spelaeicoccus albus TaxID=1280376 RepID=A0A7Z0D1C8_9MICO|nr:MurR/RpiR family transcriptional regulator [Spelaeicoccus albus]NYI65875.1 DNA-binding MurR/RpiR family transcriptional regulator [Spelaeicoccus albus]